MIVFYFGLYKVVKSFQTYGAGILVKRNRVNEAKTLTLPRKRWYPRNNDQFVKQPSAYHIKRCLFLYPELTSVVISGRMVC